MGNKAFVELANRIRGIHVLSSYSLLCYLQPLVCLIFHFFSSNVQIRLESKGGKQSSIMFCTNGVLLRLLISRGTNVTNEETATKPLKEGFLGITHVILVRIVFQRACLSCTRTSKSDRGY